MYNVIEHLYETIFWLVTFQIEIHIGEYLRKNEEETVQAVSLYLDALLAVGISWYNGEYPLVLMDNLVYQWIKVPCSILSTENLCN